MRTLMNWYVILDKQNEGIWLIRRRPQLKEATRVEDSTLKTFKIEDREMPA